MIEGFEMLEALETKLQEVASDQTRDQMLEAVGAKCLELVQEGFNKEQDPYGEAWKPRKHDKRGHRILDDSGTMKSSYSVDVASDGVAISNSAPYSAYHQDGTTTMPQRRTVPVSTLGQWEEPLKVTIEELLRAKLVK